jgi:CRISPR-associated protein Csx10
MKVITYHIHLLEPVLVTALEGDPNSSVAFDYLPGSVLRGAIIGKYLASSHSDNNRQASASSFDITDKTIRRLFFNGQTRYLNGYLVYTDDAGQQTRTLPTPHSFHAPKYHGKSSYPVYDLTCLKPDAPEMKGQEPKRIGGGFCTIEHDVFRSHTPQRLLSIHTARNRRLGRARRRVATETELSGAVYQYDSLAGGQTFAAAILCLDEDVERLVGLLSGYLHLGGSRTGGYGRVRLEYQHTFEAKEWFEIGQKSQETEQVTITLLSDLLLRDDNGHHITSAHRLAQVIGGKLLDVYAAYQPLGGFNRKWGLPLPQTVAFQMGTVLVIQPDKKLDLVQMQIDGVGERRGEGFGRIACNWHRREKYTARPPLKLTPEAKPITDPDSRQLAQDMVQRMLRQRLDAAVNHQAQTLADSVENVPAKSQIYRLRLLCQDGLRQITNQNAEDLTAYLAKSRQEFDQYLANLRARPHTRRQFDRVRLDNRDFLTWINQRVQATDADQTAIVVGFQTNIAIGFQIDEIVEDQTAGIQSQWDAKMVYEYNLRLVDAILARLAKRAREER